MKITWVFVKWWAKKKAERDTNLDSGSCLVLQMWVLGTDQQLSRKTKTNKLTKLLMGPWFEEGKNKQETVSRCVCVCDFRPQRRHCWFETAAVGLFMPKQPIIITDLSHDIVTWSRGHLAGRHAHKQITNLYPVLFLNRNQLGQYSGRNSSSRL